MGAHRRLNIAGLNSFSGEKIDDLNCATHRTGRRKTLPVTGSLSDPDTGSRIHPYLFFFVLEDHPSLMIGHGKRPGRKIKAALSQQIPDVTNSFCLCDCFHKK